MFFKIDSTQIIQLTGAADLREAVLKSATRGPQKYAMSLFTGYFSKDGTINHPELGNLLELADEIDRQYGNNRGINLVSAQIRNNLPPESSLSCSQ